MILNDTCERAGGLALSFYGQHSKKTVLLFLQMGVMKYGW